MPSAVSPPHLYVSLIIVMKIYLKRKLSESNNATVAVRSSECLIPQANSSHAYLVLSCVQGATRRHPWRR